MSASGRKRPFNMLNILATFNHEEPYMGKITANRPGKEPWNKGMAGYILRHTVANQGCCSRGRPAGR
jgi:hypothetical protein